jgi:hypothetical protein
MASNLKRVNIGLNPEKYDFFKGKADKSGVALASYITMALDQYVDSQKLLDSLPDLVEAIKKQQLKEAKD